MDLFGILESLSSLSSVSLGISEVMIKVSLRAFSHHLIQEPLRSLFAQRGKVAIIYNSSRASLSVCL